MATALNSKNTTIQKGTKRNIGINSMILALESSILKFKNLYGKNPTPDIVANKIVDNLSTLSTIESGTYFDLRDVND